MDEFSLVPKIEIEKATQLEIQLAIGTLKIMYSRKLSAPLYHHFEANIELRRYEEGNEDHKTYYHNSLQPYEVVALKNASERYSQTLQDLDSILKEFPSSDLAAGYLPSLIMNSFALRAWDIISSSRPYAYLGNFLTVSYREYSRGFARLIELDEHGGELLLSLLTSSNEDLQAFVLRNFASDDHIYWSIIELKVEELAVSSAVSPILRDLALSRLSIGRRRELRNRS